MDGLRLTKTVGTGSSAVEHKYTWQGGKLIAEYDGTNTLEFFYDESGAPYAFSCNGTTYYYVTNLQGDVVKIVNASGTSQAEYSYNAWGQVISATGTLAAINPIRYRGYYYDVETGLYYLKSRYYDPQICRFINADGLASTGQGFVGCNMFAYCNNNPVINSDKAGKLPVAQDLLNRWLFDGGEDTYFDENTTIAKKIKKSSVMKRKIAEQLSSYKETGEYNKTGSVYFGYFTPDLWLGIRRAQYSITIMEEYRTTHFLWIQKKQKRYVVEVTVFDTYDFNGIERGDGIGSILNNIGYDLQEKGIGTKYKWEVSYVYETRWE